MWYFLLIPYIYSNALMNCPFMVITVVVCVFFQFWNVVNWTICNLIQHKKLSHIGTLREVQREQEEVEKEEEKKTIPTLN